MTTYAYKCRQCETVREINHSMFDSISPVCQDCGAKMHRVIMSVNVNWNGVRPHEEHNVNPIAKDLLDNADRNRDEYLAKKEARNE